MEQDEIKSVINELIKIIPFEGVSDETLLKVCMDLNLANSFCKFQNGIYSALEYIAEDLNNSLITILRNSNLEDMEVHDRVKLAIQVCISNYAGLPNCREFLKKILLFAVLPKNMYFFSKLLYRTVSVIWYNINDKSTNFNYYMKRAVLTGVYLSTMIFFINDYSEGFEGTISFLDSLINKIMAFQKLKISLEEVVKGLL